MDPSCLVMKLAKNVTAAQSESDSSDSGNQTPEKLFKKPAKSKKCLEKSFSTLPDPPTPPTELFNAPSHSLVAVADIMNSRTFTNPGHGIVGCGSGGAETTETDGFASLGQCSSTDERTRNTLTLAVPGSQNIFALSFGGLDQGSSSPHADGIHRLNATSCLDLDTRNEIREIRRNKALIMAKLDLILDGVSTVLAGRNNKTNTTSSSIQLQLPATSLDDLNKLENEIKQTPSIKENLVSILSCSGGNNVNQISHRILSSLMTDDVMTNFTFAGKTGRTSFRETVFMGIICAAVKLQPKGATGNNQEIEKATEYWLKKAPTRIASKNKKKAAVSEIPCSANEDE